MANSGLREPMTYKSKQVFWTMTPHVVNCASTCATYTSGSAGQNGGSFMLTAARVAGGQWQPRRRLGGQRNQSPLCGRVSQSPMLDN